MYLVRASASRLRGRRRPLDHAPVTAARITRSTARNYLQQFIVPNLVFPRVGGVRPQLRHNGVELGKRDWLGELD
jgi:hypothetical protein